MSFIKYLIMKTINPSKAIPLVAGSITILNFLFSIIPLAAQPPQWLNFLSLELKPQFKFIVFFIFTLFSSLGTTKFIIELDKQKISHSTKATFVAIFTSIFGWIVVFNIKYIALSNILTGFSAVIFPVSCFIFFLFLSYKLFSDFRDQNYPLTSGFLIGWSKEKGNWPLDKFYTPTYIQSIKFFFFSFVVILGGYFYSI